MIDAGGTTSLRGRLIGVISSAVVLAVLAVVFLSANSAGATTNKTVTGTIGNLNGDPVAGASVRVEIWGGSWPERTVLRNITTTYSDSFGNYQVTINSNYWDPHNTIKVTAISGGYFGIRTVEANDQQDQTVDVTLNAAIPEFPGTPGVLAAMVVTVTVVFLLSVRKRRREVR